MKKVLSFFGIISVVIIGIFFFSKLHRPCSSSDCLPKDTLNQELFLRKRVYAQVKQNVSDYKYLEAEVTQELIDRQIIEDYAQKKRITVLDAEFEERYKSFVVKSMTPSKSENPKLFTAKMEAEFAKKIQDTYGLSLEEYKDRIRWETLKTKVQESLDKPFGVWLEEERKKRKSP